MSEPLTMPLDAFVRSIAINRRTAHALFIGAGASLSSGMPSAEKCVMEWKAQIFSSANPGLEKYVGNPFLPAVQRKIQVWLDRQRCFPPSGSDDEYGIYLERCFPVADDRRAYFQNIVKNASPSFGYQLLILLAESGLFSSVWTTNFDSLTARAANGSAVVAVEAGLDSAARVERQTRRDELLCVAMHGDYRYDALKNTSHELQQQDELLRNKLRLQLSDQTLIILGYSGRDESVMEALANAAISRGSGRIYWCGFQNAEPTPKVAELLTKARAAGRQAFYVASGGFDDTMRRLALQSLDHGLAERAKAILISDDAEAENNHTKFSLPAANITALVKSNCFPIDCPSEVYQFDVPCLKRQGAWAGLREIVGTASLVAGILGQKVVAIGSLNEIKSVFGNRIQGDVDRAPIADHEFELTNGVITGILRQALVRSLAEKNTLECNGDDLIWENVPYHRDEVYRWKCVAHRAVVIGLKRIHGRQYVTVMPTVIAKADRGGDLPDFVEKEVKRKILSVQYNDEFNKVLEHWRKKLFCRQRRTF